MTILSKSNNTQKKEVPVVDTSTETQITNAAKFYNKIVQGEIDKLFAERVVLQSKCETLDAMINAMKNRLAFIPDTGAARTGASQSAS